MNRAELTKRIAEEAGLSREDVATVLAALIETVEKAVAAGDKVTIPGFGAWARTHRAARTGRNPRTGEPVAISASKAVKFTAGAMFKRAVGGDPEGTGRPGDPGVPLPDDRDQAEASEASQE